MADGTDDVFVVASVTERRTAHLHPSEGVVCGGNRRVEPAGVVR